MDLIPSPAQWVKDLALPKLWLGLDPWLKNFHMPWVWPKKKKREREKLAEFLGVPVVAQW